MPLNNVDPYSRLTFERFRQGDILRDISYVEWAERIPDSIDIHERKLAYCVVMSQDCDLEQDYNNREGENGQPNHDKYLQSILLCPAYPAEKLKDGSHLLPQQQMGIFSTPDWKKIKQNNNYRYHYLMGMSNLQVPELALDFKHYFTIPRDVLYRKEFVIKYLVTIEDLFKDHLSSRFAHYLSRIGLPTVNTENLAGGT